MTVTPFEAPWPVSRRAARTVVVVDVVESVRLMEQGEEDFVRRWHAFLADVMAKLLPQHGGRLVKSLGDGLMVEFEAVPPAIQCAIAMQTAIAQSNAGHPADRWMCLRIGAHVADVFADDLGECYLKHLRAPIRAYRVGPVGSGPELRNDGVIADQKPVIAVIPMTVQPSDPASSFIGDIVADDIVAALSGAPEWKVISRLSSAAFRTGVHPPSDLHKHLNATYVLSGTCHVVGQRLRVIAELADARAETVVWSGSVAAVQRVAQRQLVGVTQRAVRGDEQHAVVDFIEHPHQQRGAGRGGAAVRGRGRGDHHQVAVHRRSPVGGTRCAGHGVKLRKAGVNEGVNLTAGNV